MKSLISSSLCSKLMRSTT
uniref:Uncharacterized protein n=1 Tax=Arundo donax TaxID=35708 RepID=A0A0A8ZPF0_ARUDO